MPRFKHRCPNPKCRAILAIDEKKRGKHVRCSECSQSFVVPFVLQLPAATDARKRRKAG
jgi:predicted Zn finger-like uncharacterized protein